MEFTMEQTKPFVRSARSLFMNEKFAFVNKTIRARDHRLFYIFSGDGEFETEGKRYVLKPGTAILLKAGKEYKWTPDIQKGVHYFAVNFDYTFRFSHMQKVLALLPGKSHEKVLEDIAFTDYPVLNNTVCIKNMKNIEGLLWDMQQIKERRAENFEQQLSCAMKFILYEIISRTHCNHPLEHAGLANDIIHFIHQHYAEPIGNKDISDALNFHPVYLNRVLKEETGSSMHRYLREYRIRVACELFCENQTIGIQDAAYFVGIHDASHFVRCFKAVTGMTPTEYKMKMQSDGGEKPQEIRNDY